MSSPTAPLSEARSDTADRPGRWLSLVGIGEDGIDGLSPAARTLVESAVLVVGGDRHLALAETLVHGETLAWPRPMRDAFPAITARRGRPVAVLATGDPFCYGVGRMLGEVIPADEIFCLPQPSAFSLAAARLAWSLPDLATVTLHGRPLETIVRHLQPGARVLALSWDGTTPQKLAELLVARGMGGSTLHVLEALGGPRENVRSARADVFRLENIDPLNLIGLEVVADPNALVVPLASGLDDDLFEHDGQLTKREIRAVTLSALAPRAGELLWDVGLGAGSIAIEWLLCHPAMRAIGIEARPDRAARAAHNAANLGTPDLTIVEGRAPDALKDLPAPDAVFVGGGFSVPGVFETAWAALKPGGRLVANVVTLEAEARLLDLHQRHGGELIRLAVARAEPVGTLSGFRPAMPVTQWRVRKP
ncbi:Cobalt-precorrin-6y C5-methyltransferase [Rhodovulum sp. PH10]|uniref:bifunctional cobalt-precorrin-7 (C(5))-methyltransferase/cobalt-precorrin-6B (C(15))-methyltransferase n=1 Tax=Rhodovulum sp. PH10 TaxID=1187851 RepID=UPI00027C29E4|nr:bifunctional cobalt-precorrin-7 (C(5))-methyltransferase/cobalt-precorrin-6B (C(15))-methyltransferase [Rhodovulum sp. PH10]EJW12846.1 Cobalt-precorrin-6y C5-methyltransferase [Rhodovulum sp. PH10]